MIEIIYVLVCLLFFLMIGGSIKISMIRSTIRKFRLFASSKVGVNVVSSFIFVGFVVIGITYQDISEYNKDLVHVLGTFSILISIGSIYLGIGFVAEGFNRRKRFDELMGELCTIIAICICQIFMYSMAYSAAGLVDNGDVVRNISTSMYFSLVTWTTLGYGDIQPTESVRMLAASQACFGYLYNALLVASLINLGARYNNEATGSDRSE